MVMFRKFLYIGSTMTHHIAKLKILILGGLFLLLQFALPQNVSELQLKLENSISSSQALLQQRAEEIAGIELQLGESAQTLDAQIAERDRISGELAALREENIVISDSIAALEAQLTETQSSLEQLQVQVAELKTRVQELLVNVYKQRSGRYARVLTQADSLHDLQVKNYYLSLLSDQDVNLVTELSSKATELINLQDAQNQQINELQIQQATLEDNRAALEVKSRELETAINNLNATREGQLATQKDLLQSQIDLEAKLADLQTQRQIEIVRLQEDARLKREKAVSAANALEQERLNIEAKAVEERAANLSISPPMLSDSRGIPLARLNIIGPVGSGIALRADTEGAPVYSALPGTVIQFIYISANDGYMVAIEHSNNMITAYSNLQPEVAVKIGERVEEGQLIGYLGGGGLVPPNVLKFYVKDALKNAFIDPLSVLN